MTAPDVTVDANILHALLKADYHAHPAAAALWRLHEQGRVRLHPTPQWERDVPEEPLRSRIAALLPPAAAPGGHAAALAGTAAHHSFAARRERRLFRELRDLVFPGAVADNPREARRLADVSHLIDHYRSGRAVFVTNDKAILGRAQPLRERFGIVVMGPRQAVAWLEERAGRVVEETAGAPPTPPPSR